MSPGGLLAALVLLAGVVSPPSALGHGGLSMEDDTCILRAGPYSMHFTGYQPVASGSREFCEDIPLVGQTVIVLDFLEPRLREMPVEVRIVRDTDGPEDLEAKTVFHKAAAVYPKGTLHFEHGFPEPGKFVGLVSVDGDTYVSRFPFSVGAAAGGSWLAWAGLGGLAVVAGAGLFFVSTRGG